MMKLETHGILGFHLCTLNLEKSVTRVLELLDWLPTTERVNPHSVCFFSFPYFSSFPNLNHDLPTQTTTNGTTPLPKAVQALRASSVGPVSPASTTPGRKDSPASWDEFPNGRFGDARSPAYGDLDGYGVGLKLPVSFSFARFSLALVY